MMKKKLNNKKGFTLAELLIVVAIIGILVAISIPIFTSKLADAKKATDDANLRAAKAAAVTAVLAGEEVDGQYYNADTGKFQVDNLAGYSKVVEGNVIQAEVDASTDEVSVDWATGSN